LDALSALATSALARRALGEEMAYLARHDTLTGLHNRAVFEIPVIFEKILSNGSGVM